MLYHSAEWTVNSSTLEWTIRPQYSHMNISLVTHMMNYLRQCMSFGPSLLMHSQGICQHCMVCMSSGPSLLMHSQGICQHCMVCMMALQQQSSSLLGTAWEVWVSKLCCLLFFRHAGTHSKHLDETNNNILLLYQPNMHSPAPTLWQMWFPAKLVHVLWYDCAHRTKQKI